MALILRKKLFARNRWRENEAGSFFSRAAANLSSISPLIIAVFFTPALITTSLFSTEIFIPLANIFLSLGYLTNFFYRLYKKELSVTEIVLTILVIAALITLTSLLFPPAGLTLLGVVNFVNQMAIAVNVFFVIKNVIVPPLKRLIEFIVKKAGFDIAGHYFYKRPFDEKVDLFALQRLLKKNGHKDLPESKKQFEIDKLNNLISKLSDYINKYDESFLGYIIKKNAILALEGSINQLTGAGDSDSSYAFIRKKISYKETKVELLQNALKIVTDVLNDSGKDPAPALAYFKSKGFFHTASSKDELIEGIKCIDSEIARQQAKIDSLQGCLPTPALS